jgi:hypothetical protein
VVGCACRKSTSSNFYRSSSLPLPAALMACGAVPPLRCLHRGPALQRHCTLRLEATALHAFFYVPRNGARCLSRRARCLSASSIPPTEVQPASRRGSHPPPPPNIRKTSSARPLKGQTHTRLPSSSTKHPSKWRSLPNCPTSPGTRSPTAQGLSDSPYTPCGLRPGLLQQWHRFGERIASSVVLARCSEQRSARAGGTVLVLVLAWCTPRERERFLSDSLHTSHQLAATEGRRHIPRPGPPCISM